MESTKKIYTINVEQDSESRFAIHHRDGDDEKMFGGFYNEVDCVGTEDECQCWENEDWTNTERDAIKFESYAEAKAIFDNLEDNANCNVVLYTKGYRQNFGGTEWYPLKTFKV
jgi:hypothetical protein